MDSTGELTGATFDRSSPWRSVTDHLIAWDLPAYPGYVEDKSALFALLDERWDFVFDDPGSELDVRLLSWGGVLIDDRPLGATAPCPRGCIPALDDPPLVTATEGGWYPDDALVFGVEVDGDAVALPKNVMEVHEMVNATLGGRRVALPYCTLCGSAQLYFTDEVEGAVDPLVLRTSGLLVRSNKVMYDLQSRSVVDTFTGRAVTGPLREAGAVLEQGTVVTTTWADWRRTHPATRIVAEGGGPRAELSARSAGGPRRRWPDLPRRRRRPAPCGAGAGPRGRAPRRQHGRLPGGGDADDARGGRAGHGRGRRGGAGG